MTINFDVDLMMLALTGYLENSDYIFYKVARYNDKLNAVYTSNEPPEFGEQNVYYFSNKRKNNPHIITVYNGDGFEELGKFNTHTSKLTINTH